MQTTDCTKFQEDLKAYADGELTLAKRLQVGAHLEGCAACREEVTQMERIARDMRSLENIGEVRLSPELRAKVLARLNEVRPTITPSVPFWKRQPLLTFGSAGAALAAATVLIFLYAPARQMAESEFARSAPSAPAPAGAPPPAAMAAAAESQQAPREESAKENFAVAAGDSRAAAAGAVARRDVAVSASLPEPKKAKASKSEEPSPSLDARVQVSDSAASTMSRARMESPGSPRKPEPAEYKVRQMAAKPQAALDDMAKKSAESQNIPLPKDAPAKMAAAPAPVIARSIPPAAARARPTTSAPARPALSDADKEVSIIVEVEDIKAAEQRIETLAKEAGGSLTSDTQDGEGERKPYTARIPVKEVEAFRKSVAQLGKPLPNEAEAMNDKNAAGGFGGGAAAKADSENKSIRVILVRKPSP